MCEISEIDPEVIELCKNKTIKDIKEMLGTNTKFDVERVEKLFNLSDSFNELFNESYEYMIDYMLNSLEVDGRDISEINCEILDVLVKQYLNLLNNDVQSFAENFENDNVCNSYFD